MTQPSQFSELRVPFPTGGTAVIMTPSADADTLIKFFETMAQLMRATKNSRPLTPEELENL